MQLKMKHISYGIAANMKMKGICLLILLIYQMCVIVLGCSGENLFVDQSNFFLDDYTDWQPSSRNTHQEYSFHLYSGGTSPPK